MSEETGATVRFCAICLVVAVACWAEGSAIPLVVAGVLWFFYSA